MGNKTEEFKILEKQFSSYLRSRNILKVAVALSGGPDSVALAHLLNKTNCELIALHCNFHLRGDESYRDSSFVENFCKTQNIPLKSIDFNIPEFLKLNPGISIEMACRKLRYDWFSKIREEKGYDRLAVGHNADDNIETFFLNLLRGSGTKGLRGMEEDNGIIWRPLLKIHREQIMEYLKSNHLNYVIDSSNLESDFRRNYLRNIIFPLFKDKWPGWEKALDSSLRNIYFENKIVEDYLLKALPQNGKPLKVETIINFPDPLLLIRRYINPLRPYKTIPEEVLAAIKAKKPHIRKWRLPLGSVVLRNGNLYLYFDQET